PGGRYVVEVGVYGLEDAGPQEPEVLGTRCQAAQEVLSVTLQHQLLPPLAAGQSLTGEACDQRVLLVTSTGTDPKQRRVHQTRQLRERDTRHLSGVRQGEAAREGGQS